MHSLSLSYFIEWLDDNDNIYSCILSLISPFIVSFISPLRIYSSPIYS